MAQYRKKPVVIEAVVWNGNNNNEIVEFCGLDNCYFSENQKELFIPTLEGDHKATISDYIIKGVNGEFYPIKDEIFLKTYEKVGD